MRDQDDTMKKYGDIIYLPYYGSRRKKRMSLYDRAAQFAPFAALSGYEDMVAEEARLTDSKSELSESSLEVLEHRLESVLEILNSGESPHIAVTFFVNDKNKSGGQYMTVWGKVKEINVESRKIILYGSDDTENRKIHVIEVPLDDIRTIECNEYDCSDDV